MLLLLSLVYEIRISTTGICLLPELTIYCWITQQWTMTRMVITFSSCFLQNETKLYQQRQWSVCLSVCLPVCLSVGLLVGLSVYLSVCLFVCRRFILKLQSVKRKQIQKRSFTHSDNVAFRLVYMITGQVLISSDSFVARIICRTTRQRVSTLCKRKQLAKQPV